MAAGCHSECNTPGATLGEPEAEKKGGMSVTIGSADRVPCHGELVAA